MRSFLIVSLVFVSFSAMFTGAAAQSQITIERGSQRLISAGKFTVKFIEVVEDSRCPPDVQCIWAGNAKVKLSIAKGKAAPRIFELNSNMEPDVIRLGGYTFKFVDLTRGPGEEPNDQIVKPKLTIAVTKQK